MYKESINNALNAILLEYNPRKGEEIHIPFNKRLDGKRIVAHIIFTEEKYTIENDLLKGGDILGGEH